MTREEQKRIVQQQRAGHQHFERLEIEAERLRTVEERLEAFSRIEQLAKHLPKNESREDDDEVMEKWIKIRNRYDASLR